MAPLKVEQLADLKADLSAAKSVDWMVEWKVVKSESRKAAMMVAHWAVKLVALMVALLE